MSRVETEPFKRLTVQVGPVNVEILTPEEYAKKIKIKVQNETPTADGDIIAVQETQPPGEAPDAMQ